MHVITQLMSLYAQIDQKVAAFQIKSGLRCLSGCGRCCPNAPVESTALEMFPAAHEILLRGEGLLWLERIQANAPSVTCVFYSTDAEPDKPGRCGFYGWRPTVCRLFGFAAVRNRKGQKMFSTCKVLKEQSPRQVAAAIAIADEAPCFSEVGSQVFALDPGQAPQLLPINIALQKAIQALGLGMQMHQNETLGNTTAA